MFGERVNLVKLKLSELLVGGWWLVVDESLLGDGAILATRVVDGARVEEEEEEETRGRIDAAHNKVRFNF